MMELLSGWSMLLVLFFRDPVLVWLLILIRECVEACGSLVPMRMRSSIHKFLRESSLLKKKDETFVGTRILSLCLISVCRDDGICCVFTLLLNLALFNLKL